MKTFSQKEKILLGRGSVQNFVVRGGLWRDGERAETAETGQPGRAEGGQEEEGVETGLWGWAAAAPPPQAPPQPLT